MVGLQLSEFISQLRARDPLAEYDRTFLSIFDDQFPAPALTENALSPEQILWLQKAFADRWTAVKGTSDEYTRNPADINELWIKLARDLSAVAGKTFLQLLMPTVKNTKDPNNFAKLADCDDLRTLYLSEDDETLYSLTGLLDRLQTGQAFSTYNAYSETNKKYIPRPLGIKELARIKLRALNPVIFKGKAYANFFDFLHAEITPQWTTGGGELPRHLLPSLLDMVESYFAEGESEEVAAKFAQKLAVWVKLLQECSIDDVNCLYGQKIVVDGKELFLIDILLDCAMASYPSLHDKMLGLARWICKYDFAFASKKPELAAVYAELNAGQSFDLARLKLELDDLHANTTSRELQDAIHVLRTKLDSKDKIDDEIKRDLKDLYKQRWLQVQGTSIDYTRLQGGVNAHWIRLAQLLCGARHIRRNYYAFLMPTLEPVLGLPDQEPVSKAYLTDYPLSHFVLSENGRALIYLGSCKTHYEVNGTFYNCNTETPKPLTAVELERVAFANRKYHRYIKFAKGEGPKDFPISKETVAAVYHLVNKSLYADGLRGDYSDTQWASAEKAFADFSVFLHSLPKAERERLLNQRIIYRGRNVSFKSVLVDIQSDRCVALGCRYFAQMVMDYAPYLMFTPEIEAKIVLSNDEDGPIDMRMNSRKKVFSDYNALDAEEVKRRIQVLAVSLMTHGFNYSFVGETVSVWDCSNRMVGVAKEICQLIAPMLITGDFKDARHVYMAIMESIVIPKLTTDKPGGIFFSWHTDTQRWLSSVANGILFSQEHVWNKPEVLLTKLYMLLPALDAGTQPLLQSFLETLVHTYAQAQNTTLKDIRVNVKFTQFLATLSAASRAQIFAALDAPTPTVDAKSFYITYGAFLIKGMCKTVFAAGARSSRPGLFLAESAHGRQQCIKAILMDIITHAPSHESLKTLFLTLRAKVDDLADTLCNAAEKASMQRYLDKMQSPISCPSPVYGPVAMTTLDIIPPSALSPTSSERIGLTGP